MKWSRETRISGHPIRTAMVRAGIVLAAVSGLYLALGILSVVELQLEDLSWNNIRIVAGCCVAGCLMAAVGFGNR